MLWPISRSVSVILVASFGLAESASASGAPDSDDLRVVEASQDAYLRLEQTDIMVEKNPAELIQGVTRQFNGGQELFGEVKIVHAMPLETLRRFLQTKGSAVSFHCATVTIYEQNDIQMVGGDECRIINSGR